MIIFFPQLPVVSDRQLWGKLFFLLQSSEAKGNVQLSTTAETPFAFCPKFSYFANHFKKS
jgi:hypothetical protein